MNRITLRWVEGGGRYLTMSISNTTQRRILRGIMKIKELEMAVA